MDLLNLLPQILFEATVNGIPQRVLGSASYQVGKMDVLNVSADVRYFRKPAHDNDYWLTAAFCSSRGRRLSFSSFSCTTAARSPPAWRTRGGSV